MPAGGGNAERVTFGGSYNISPAVSPDGRTLAYITRSGGAFRLHAARPRRRRRSRTTLTDTSDDESPSFAPNGRLHHLRHARAGARRVDDDHARWQDQGAPAVSDGRSCASRCGARSGASRRAVFERMQHSKGNSHEHPSIDTSSPLVAAASLAALLERQARRPGAGRDRAAGAAVVPRQPARRRRRGGAARRRAVAPVDLTGSDDGRHRQRAAHRLLRLRQLRRQGRVPAGRSRRTPRRWRPTASKKMADRRPHRRARRPRIQPRARPEARRGGAPSR